MEAAHLATHTFRVNTSSLSAILPFIEDTMYSRSILLISAIAGMMLLYTLFSKVSVLQRASVNSILSLQAHLFSVDPYLNAKLARAEKLWRQSVEDRQTMRSKMGSRDFPDGYINPYNVWDFARPSFFCPHDLERVGTLGDGGKIVCGMSRYERESPGPSADSNPAQELIVYSFGVSDDSSFEAALLERTNARIWGYDYSVNTWASQVTEQYTSRATFQRAGIAKKTEKDKSPPFFTIQDLMEINGHSYVDIIKMDIEGAEFDAMSSLISSVADRKDGNTTLPFGQLLVEIHFMRAPPGCSIPQDLETFMLWWSTMEEYGLRPVNNEDNWIGDVGFGKPRFMEVSRNRSFMVHLTLIRPCSTR